MKRAMPFWILLTLLAAMGSGIASPVGNFSNPAFYNYSFFDTAFEIRDIEIGVVTTFDYNVAENELASIDDDNNWGTVSIDSYGMKWSIVTEHPMQVYAMFDIGKLSKDFSFKEKKYEIKADPSFIYGLGVSTVFYEYEVHKTQTFRAGFDIKYRKLEFSSDDIKEDGKEVDFRSRFGHNYSICFEEYQFALILSYRLGNFTPYVGSKYLTLRGDEKFMDLTKSIEDNSKGPFLGVSYNLNDLIAFEAEGRYGHEEAYTLSLSVKFF